jgi:hypothetical protein
MSPGKEGLSPAGWGSQLLQNDDVLVLQQLAVD